MNPDKIIIRFAEVAEQSAGPVLRIVGLVRARDALPLFDAADLEANPRSAKVGNLTEDIQESIRDTPKIFPFKTKGILVGASEFQRLQRNRYELRFANPHIEGILDGGHNILAIGTYILSTALNDMTVKRKIRRWPDFKEEWENRREEIEAFRKRDIQAESDFSGSLDFLIPIEILVPSNLEDEKVVEEFNNSLLSICSARNNNVELTLETKANKKGYFEELRRHLPEAIAERVEWKTNDGGDIKVRDIIALSWIPLSKLDLSYLPKFPPQNIYRNKGECAKLFDDLMSHKEVSEPTDGEYTRKLHNKQVVSALKLAGQFPELYDLIYKKFPAAYNSDGDGKFGNLAVVKMSKDMHSSPTTHFGEEEVEYSYPDGLIMPLVYGLRRLIRRKQDGCVSWRFDPNKFIEDHLAAIVRRYRVILKAYDFDPQKVGKNEGSYELVMDAIDTELMRKDRAE